MLKLNNLNYPCFVNGYRILEHLISISKQIRSWIAFANKMNLDQGSDLLSIMFDTQVNVCRKLFVHHVMSSAQSMCHFCTVLRIIKLKLFPVSVWLHSGSGKFEFRRYFIIFCDIYERCAQFGAWWDAEWLGVTRRLTRLQTMRNVLKCGKIIQHGSVRWRFGCGYFFNLLMFSTVPILTNCTFIFFRNVSYIHVRVQCTLLYISCRYSPLVMAFFVRLTNLVL